MCRLAGWIGAPRPLSSLVQDPPHGLEHQAYAPRQLLSGTVNVDGTGIAWWPKRTRGDAEGAEREPLLYRGALPPWADGNLVRLAPRLQAELILANVRSATPGQALGAEAVAPFAHGELALAHNGFVEHFAARARRSLLADLDDDLFSRAEPATDSHLLLLHLAQEKRRAQGPSGSLGDWVAALLAGWDTKLRALALGARLDLVAADGEHLVAARFAVGLEPNSLYLHPGPEGLRVASEPLDDHPDWRPLEPGTLLESDGAQLRVRTLTA